MDGRPRPGWAAIALPDCGVGATTSVVTPFSCPFKCTVVRLRVCHFCRCLPRYEVPLFGTLERSLVCLREDFLWAVFVVKRDCPHSNALMRLWGSHICRDLCRDQEVARSSAMIQGCDNTILLQPKR